MGKYTGKKAVVIGGTISMGLATVDVHYVALRALLELCKEREIHHAVPDAFDQLFQAAIKAGYGQDDFAVLNKFMRERSRGGIA